MISWTYKNGNLTHLVCFDKNMNELANLVESKNEWAIHLGSKIIRIKGNGCKDPLRFIECLVSPSPILTSHNKNNPILEFVHPDGETWEVWKG